MLLSCEFCKKLRNLYEHLFCRTSESGCFSWNQFINCFAVKPSLRLLRCSKAFFRSFSGANILSHYIIPTLIDCKLDAVVIHIGTNDVLNHTSHEDIVSSMINIGLDRKNNGVTKVLILSLLVKKNPNLTDIVCRVNDMLRDLCDKNGFNFICHDVITSDYLWKDCVHLQDMGTNFK